MSARVRDLDPRTLRERWPLPEPEGGKEGRGRVVVVGGSRRTPGAVLLATEAAVRAGAGKPQVATVASVAVAVGVALPEALVSGLPETDDGELSASGADDVVGLAEDCDALLVGPGLLSPDRACELLEQVVPRLRCPLVLDALGMAYLTEHPDGLGSLASRTVLTPNASELAQTLRRDEDSVEADLVGSCVELAERTGATVVAGGQETFVATPGAAVVWRQEGLPGLGVAGSGDVKAGVVAGLLARGLPAQGAGAWGIALHVAAGRRIGERHAPVGFLAREVLPLIPQEMARLGSAGD